MRQIVTMIIVSSFCFGIQAQSRVQYTINSNWSFYKGYADVSDQDIPWQDVTIPHSWNVEDVLDDEPGYYRDTACYTKDLHIPAAWKDKQVYLIFDAIGINADIYMNGKLARSHTGAYTSFNVNITDYIDFAEDGNAKNQLFVRANNTFTDDVAPLSADFTFFGGIYRDVHLVALDNVHFRMDKYNSKGVFWNTPKVSEKSAKIVLNGAFISSLAKTQEVFVEHLLYSKDGEKILSHLKAYKNKGGETTPFSCKLKLKKPGLWSPENPNLYRLVSRLKVDGKIVDEIENPIAFRWFEFDAEEGFSLNGEPCYLVGASRHQDYANMGNALDDALHLHDIELLKEMGGNFLRIAHYPQDETIIQACDRLGILCSIEIPLVNAITESEAFFDNAEFMLREMMAQYYNNPSLIIWAYMNEIFLRMPVEEGTEAYEKYLISNNQLFTRLDNIIRENDPYRYTMMVGHGGGDVYKKAGLIDIPQLFGWNIYTGWYDGRSSRIGSTLDRRHELCGDVPMLVTEYGADADIRIHNFDADRFDKSVEYATDYHVEYMKAFYERKFVNGMMVWNLADFSSESRTETTPHVNAKGLLTIDRKEKDGYRFYKAIIGKEPYVGIGSKEWNFRTDIAKTLDDAFVEQPVQVFSNAGSVQLLHNGSLLAEEEVTNGIASFTVPFKQGVNQLLARATIDELEITDQVNIDFHVIPVKLKNESLQFQELNASLGDRRFYTDYDRHENWLPAQEYTAGSWGYIGGEVFKMDNTKRQSYGSNINIRDTDLDAIYATQVEGIKEFRFDVPDGNYTLTLHFAELRSDIEHEALAYNLDDEAAGTGSSSDRVFSVSVNEQLVLPYLSNKEQLVPEKAISFKINARARNGKGIVVIFEAIKGEAILNGIQLRKTR